MWEREVKTPKLSELSGVSRATISYIRNGKSCSEEVARKIAKALNCDVTELLEE
mgnify:FL=1